MKILMLDIETAPNLVYCWGLFNQNIATNQISKPGYTMCYTAQWYGKKEVIFDSIHKTKPLKMFKGVRALLDEADAVCHYNGAKFDIPTLEWEFIQKKIDPPSPYKQIDLLRTSRRFKMPSRKMEYVCQQLGLSRKVVHKGMPLWTSCMGGDPAAWKIMERYNRRDVKMLIELHDMYRPWIKNYPNVGVFDSVSCCPKCASQNIQRRGYYVTRSKKYPQAQCRDCFAWLYLISGNYREGMQEYREAL